MLLIRLSRYSKNLPIVLLGICLHQTSWAVDEGWYLTRNQMSLNAGNRYFSTLNVVNNTGEPVYLKSRVDKLSLENGERKRSPDTDQGLTLSPEEFVLPPRKSVELRIFAKPGLQSSVSQSYYANLTDVSSAHSLNSGANTGFLLSYDFMVAVAGVIDQPIKAENFTITSVDGAKVYAIRNESGRHIFLGESYACENTKQPLVECTQLNDFPKQSLLPAESLQFTGVADMKVFGFLLFNDLNMNGLQKAYLQPVTLR